ncbi:MAG: hypothetical protein J6X98_01290 [Bacteroidales bacterium]|nr:hypothetical protein [Bacteroidales bacterium]
MIPTLTYPPQHPRSDMGGYRYFFNGQEADNEVLGEGGLAGYEFRQYDTRLGRWWGIDRKAAKYPSLSPYQFCADNPIWMVDVDGSDFVVTVEKSGSENIITVKMNVYAISETAYKQLLAATDEINSITRTVTIDNVEYTLYFEINPFPPSETNDIKKSKYIEEGKALSEGYLGNVFLGTKYQEGVQEVVRDGHTGYVGGRTSGKSSWMYPGPDGLDFGNYYKLVGHELLHLLGLDDEGGEYYAPEGRMEYIASPYNGFDMNDISNKDIQNILKFAFLFNQAIYAKEKVRVDYLDDIDPIIPNPKIEVK